MSISRRHDVFMLAESGLLPKLQRRLTKPNDEPYIIYGDPAYPVRRQILAPFRGARLAPDEERFTNDMSTVTTSAE